MGLVRTNDIESECLAPPAVLDVKLRGAARPFPVARTRKMAIRRVNGNGLLKQLVEMVTIQLGDLVQGSMVREASMSLRAMPWSFWASRIAANSLRAST